MQEIPAAELTQRLDFGFLLTLRIRGVLLIELVSPSAILLSPKTKRKIHKTIVAIFDIWAKKKK